MLAAAGCGEEGAPSFESARVASVADGDTVRLDDGRNVRLVQIDAPEPEGECFGRAASRVLADLLPPGTTLELERDPRLDSRDRFGRLLRYAHTRGRNINIVLVERGAAAPYFFRRDRGRHASELLEAAEDARSARRGLWGACPFARLAPGRGLDAGPP